MIFTKKGKYTMQENNLINCKEIVKHLIDEADYRQAVLTLTFLSAMMGKETTK